jgi:hypothetical protein
MKEKPTRFMDEWTPTTSFRLQGSDSVILFVNSKGRIK